MNKKYRFSIVIPTRNRVATLAHTLATCLGQRNFEDYEIVVNDNSDGDKIRLYVGQVRASDPRAFDKIKYKKRAQVCSMSGNFEEALSRTQGEYVIVLGDDDGILPMALWELDRLVTKTKSSIVKWRNGLYNWPDLNFQGWENYLGFSLERAFRMMNGREQLDRSLVTLNYDNLPMLYINAAIRYDVIEGMRDTDGRLFGSRSPDVYSAIVLGYFSGDFIDVSVPFTLAGLSGSSNGVSTAFGGNNPAPRADFWRLNWQDGIFHTGSVPNLPIFPVVDFCDSFTLAKGRYFSTDETLTLPRERIMRACIERCDTSDEQVRKELLRACEDDPDLTQYSLDLMAQDLPKIAKARLRPENLGADGVNLHLDGSDFSLRTIKDAVDFVHRILWPKDAPLRYDLTLAR